MELFPAVQAAHDTVARQPEERKPWDLAGLLRDAERELESREAKQLGHVERGSVAARARVRAAWGWVRSPRQAY